MVWINTKDELPKEGATVITYVIDEYYGDDESYCDVVTFKDGQFENNCTPANYREKRYWAYFTLPI